MVDFEGCFKIKIIKIHKVDHWSGKKFEILGHTYGLCGGHPIICQIKYMQLFGKVWRLKWQEVCVTIKCEIKNSNYNF